jgi:hypothetical protein
MQDGCSAVDWIAAAAEKARDARPTALTRADNQGGFHLQSHTRGRRPPLNAAPSTFSKCPERTLAYFRARFLGGPAGFFATVMMVHRAPLGMTASRETAK